MDELENLGKLLKMSRIAIGKTIKEMAQRMSVCVSTIAKWETSDTFPSEDQLIFVAWNYKIGLHDLEHTWKRSREIQRRISEARKKPILRKPNPEWFGNPGRSGSGRTRSGFAYKY